MFPKYPVITGLSGNIPGFRPEFRYTNQKKMPLRNAHIFFTLLWAPAFAFRFSTGNRSDGRLRSENATGAEVKSEARRSV
jgi:hypothetical protein